MLSNHLQSSEISRRCLSSNTFEPRLPGSLENILHRHGDVRIPEARLPISDSILVDHRSILPSAPSYSYTPSGNPANMPLIQDRPISTHTGTQSSNYPLLSPHSLLQGAGNPTNSLSSPSYMSSSPTSVFGSMSLSGQLYPGASSYSSSYVHTTEGNTLEILGNQSTPLDIGRADTLIGRHADEDVDKNKSHMRLPHQNPDDHEQQDPVWRPY